VCALFFNITPNLSFNTSGVAQNQQSTISFSLFSQTAFAVETEDIKGRGWGEDITLWTLETFKGSVVTAIGDTLTKGIMFLIGIIAFVLSYVSGMALVLASAILDAAVALSTTGLSDIVNGSGRDAIDQTWRIFRDLANIGFVFVLLYVAITFILSADSSGTKKMLSNTIIAAFLVNFSFFFAALVVDVSNQMAVAVNDKIEEMIGDDTISSFIAKKTEIQSTTKSLGVTQNNVDSQDEGGSQSLEEVSQQVPMESDAFIQWGTSMVLTVILHLVLSIVFLIGAFMFVSRTLTIILLLITSPIGFVGRVLPSTSKLGKDWWESLFGNAFALPVFLLFIYVAFKLIGGGILDVIPRSSASMAGASFTELVVPELISPLLRYGIVIGFFIGALSAAKKMNSMGIAVVSKINGQITSNLGRGAMASAGWAGRQSVGRLANNLAENDRFKNMAAKWRPAALALQATRGVGGSSFDARGSTVFKGVASATGINEKEFGAAGGKGGYRTSLKEAREAETTFAAEAIGQISKDEAEKASAVSSAKTNLDVAKTALDTARTTAGTPKNVIEQAKLDVEKEQKAYNKALAQEQNKNLEAYGKRLDKSIIFRTSRKAAGKTISKELEKALKDPKGAYDIVKALKAAKGDKKEE
jgi:hypothetical protein